MLPTGNWPQAGQSFDGPTAIELALPSWCRVSPNPMIGAALASSMALSDSDPRMELLCSCCSRDVIRPCKGVASTATPASASPAQTRISMAIRPRAASRTAR